MSEWILEFDQVDYCYAGSNQTAIQGLTLKVPHGKRCALIGQNGCGKTTCFLLANALYKPQRGTLRWQHQPIQYSRQFLTQLRQNVGLVFQNPEHQLVAATVEEDISYGLFNLGLPETEVAQRTRQAITDFDLQSLANQPIHTLSLGQKKRVSIADVMVLRPKLLLLDEPTAYLDPHHTQELIYHLQQIHATGTTILLATHDLDFVYQWADWVFVMDQGRLILEGTPQTVFDQPDILKALGLGVPLVVELIDQMQAVVNDSGERAAINWETLQQKIFQIRRLR